MPDTVRRRALGTIRASVTLQGAKAEELAQAIFYEHMLRDDLRCVRVIRWATPAERPCVADAETVFQIVAERWSQAVVRICGQLVHLEVSDGGMLAVIAYRSAEGLELVLARLRQAFPLTKADERQVVPVTFWTARSDGPQRSSRELEVAAWNEIRGNYSINTRGALDALATDFAPARGGQLLLWSGEPGTGKTYAIRALAWEWRAWCRFHYLTNPERFLGEDTYGLMRMVLDLNQDDRDAPTGTGEPDLWHLLLLEDAGELLTADAKERAGQGLSRLLNIVDGLLGQGLRLLVMITTNERITTLHPAVARPGRCAFLHEFNRLPTEEANAWLRSRGTEAAVTAPASIAELYGLIHGFQRRERRVMGFHGALQ